MKPIALLTLLFGLALPGCSDASDDKARDRTTATGAAPAAGQPAVKRGTKIVVRRSDFGRMLFNSKRQAIYIFDNDSKDRSNCYGDCAEAWPPVFTKGKPVAGKGVRRGLLGTTTRRGGTKQVTYKGQPLYYYAHEDPGQVLCHDVFLNGGYWWVVGPDGRRRP